MTLPQITIKVNEGGSLVERTYDSLRSGKGFQRHISDDLQLGTERKTPGGENRKAMVHSQGSG